MKQLNTMKFKVSRLALLEKVCQKEYEDDSKYEVAMAEWRNAVACAASAVALTLYDVAERLTTADNVFEAAEEFLSDPRYGQPSWNFHYKTHLPAKPVKSNHSRAISLLEMSTDETITISSDSDFGQYL